MSSEKIDLERLKDPFDPSEIEWRVQQSGMKGDKPWARIIPYLQNRAIMDRLDEVVGPENWKNQYANAPEGGVLCGISININGEWVTKWDGAENTDIEGVKGGLSNSMKRAAVQWGIGRFLYHCKPEWAVFTEDRNSAEYTAKIDGKNYFWNAPISGNGNGKKSSPPPPPKKEPESDPNSPATREQREEIVKLCGSYGLENSKAKNILGIILSKEVKSTGELTFAEANKIIVSLQNRVETQKLIDLPF